MKFSLVKILKILLQKLSLVLLFSLFLSANSFAARQIEEKNYFASLRASETNVRAGPGQQYPIKFIFKARGVPVRVVSEYDNWNEIEDYEGQSGWVSQSLLTKKRTLMVQTTQASINMYSKRNEKSRVLYRLKNHVVGDYLNCQDDWCMIKVADRKGWVRKNLVFGSE